MGITPEEHHANIEAVALCWLELNQVEQWQYCDTFWKWWMNQWNANCMQAIKLCGYDLETKGKLPNMAVNEFGILIYPHNDFVQVAKSIQGNTFARLYPAKPLLKKIKTQIS